jgi:hypothetical protein
LAWSDPLMAGDIPPVKCEVRLNISHTGWAQPGLAPRGIRPARPERPAPPRREMVQTVVQSITALTAIGALVFTADAVRAPGRHQRDGDL